ncbi:tetratricopeptide repeat protein [Actinomadura barringtoniae]|uniref:Tetratricopeptide repeat protein n=1 Tax=Actinomadura barringtoniae TaxID=1427535 RepID=A0A939TF09_9ACTN|nr:BTAD domain-containing putative transcriptional regulator [Actinomadura barringtoniae]MBO2453895.1 tetratricopeptide repeat protein [Actinomadura barringtoniae]
MRIRILGPLEVADDGRPVEVGGARLRALLILLALDAGRTLPADRLIDDLWEERTPAAAPNALQSLVSRLRTVIGREHLESRPGTYRLLLPREAVDAHDFEARVAAARRSTDPARRSAELREALALWRGPALADVTGLPFADGPAARLEGLRDAALDERIDADLALGRHDELIPELRALTAADPLREPLRGRLIRALYAAGRQADALAEYEAIKQTLADSLGVDPSPDLEELYLAVLRQDSTLASASAPEPQAAEPRRPRGAAGNLRAAITSFIGRDLDLDRVAELLETERLVTLTGPGGAGKTRLSLEAARRASERMPDGAWAIELAPIVDPSEVPSAVLTALDLRDKLWTAPGPGRQVPADANDPLDRLATALADQRLLLVLDNCEHLLDAAARLADRLLADAPGVRILATSREPLGITGEVLWPVESLSPPPPNATAAEAMTYPAVQLLADRAAAVSPGFTVNAGNVADITKICHALDGMPLAIELAAARLRAMPPRLLAARLGDRFRLLNAGSRTALPRHKTLRAVVGWSWDLLDEPERTLWRRLAVFTGGATVESAEDVCAGPGLERADVLEVLTALVDKSLVIVTDTAQAPRYRMLETLRAYGLERLAEAGEEDRVRAAYAAHFLALAENAEPRLYRDEQIEWLGRLSADHDNLHAAMRWAIAAGDGRMAVRFVAALGWYWFLRGQMPEGTDTFVWVLAMPGLPEDETTARALSFGGLAALDRLEADPNATAWLYRAREICDFLGRRPDHPVLRVLSLTLDLFLHHGWDHSALTLFSPLLDDPDDWVRGVARFAHGQVALNFGDISSAADDFERAESAFRNVGDRWGLSFSLHSLAELRSRRGEHEDSAAMLEEALRLNDELGGGPGLVLQTHMKLANELILLGQRDRAVKLLTEALDDAEHIQSREGRAALNYELGEIARWEGDFPEAARLLDKALAVAETITGPPHFRALTLCSRGQLDLAMNDLPRARSRLKESLKWSVRAMDYPVVAYALAGFAGLALREGAPDRAAELIGVSDTLRGSPDLSLWDVLRIQDVTRKALGESAYAAAYERGLDWTFEDVLAAFSMERPSPPALSVGRLEQPD